MKKGRNINNFVSVNLTPAGEAVWAAYWSGTRLLIEGKMGVPDSCRHTTPEGRTLFQHHELMHIFGPELYNGNNRQMFKDNLIWIEE